MKFRLCLPKSRQKNPGPKSIVGLFGTVVELVDTPDLKSVEHYAHEGSSPSRPIFLLRKYPILQRKNSGK